MPDTKILLAEDDPLLRDLYVDTLTQAGYTVDTAVDGEQTLTKLKLGGYSLALIDVIMPKIDGITIVKKIKDDPPPNPLGKIIFLSNLDNDTQKKQALAVGDAYIVKSSVNPGELLEQVRKFL